jgi:two-component system, chemotaxis family, sensor kinase CheA
MDDLLQEFIAETRETLEALSGEIIAWEASPDDRARLDAIFRFVHTVKGSCGFLDLPRLERLSHAAEDVLAAVREGTRRPDRRLVSAVLGVVDRIGEIVEAIDAGVALDNTGEDLLIAALDEDGKNEAEAVGGVAAPSIASRAPTRSVRLSVELLDRMMSGMSDMVLARNELSRRLRDAQVDPAIEAALERLSSSVAEMRDTVTRTRMQKIDGLFSALPRVVRDTATGLGKQVSLSIEGADVELDREMIEVMRDPLVHIIRNAIDHGLETPEERQRAGKREQGRLSVSASQAGNQIVIEIADDGRGIDVERVIAKLVAQGRDERALRQLSDKAKLALIFEPGLSTKDQVTAVSGRGVGMDVVRACIDQIGGRIDLDNTPGRGLRIAIHVPLTLSIISTIIVGVGGQSFAIPRLVIEEILAVRSNAIRLDALGSASVVTIRDRRLPVIDMRVLLGLAAPDADDPAMLVVIGLGAGSFVLGVDAVVDNEELVIKPAAPAIMAAGIYAGQTLPDSGRPMLLLDCAGLASVAGLRFQRDTAEGEAEAIESDVDAGIELLLFRDLDGATRAAPLAIVDRIEPASADAVRRSAGRMRLSIDGALLPLAMAGELPEHGGFSVLRLKDGTGEMGYAIAEPADIVRLADGIVAARDPGPVAGVAMIGGEPVELIDAFWLFAEHVEARPPELAPLCRLDGAQREWMATFLAPMLRNAGYRVAMGEMGGETPAIVVRLDGEAQGGGDAVPVVRLHSDLGGASEGSVYRYDREGLLAALSTQARRSGAVR